MNIHLFTEFKTEDKFEYNFTAVTSGKLRFKVRAPNDAHVALTTGPTEGNPMYEVSNMVVYLKTLNGLLFLV
jgi:Flp pilus assembly protein TadG